MEGVIAISRCSTAAAMASMHCFEFERCQSYYNPWNCSEASSTMQQPISRRSTILISVLPLSLFLSPQPLLARERRNRKTIPPEDYLTSLIAFCKLQLHNFSCLALPEQRVHFDYVYRNITAVSSRESKLLAGNCIIAQPYEFQIRAQSGKERKREFVDNPNGLFSAQAAPKPPKAMYTITEGMKVGEKRTVIVPPEAGYGQKRMNEIPPGATFELDIELLEVKAPGESNAYLNLRGLC